VRELGENFKPDWPTVTWCMMTPEVEVKVEGAAEDVLEAEELDPEPESPYWAALRVEETSKTRRVE
jgi:hypothetical protein